MMGSPHNSLSFTLRWLLVPRTHSQTNQLQRAQQAATHTDTLSRFLFLSVTLCTRLKLPVVFLLMLFRGFGVWGRKSEALWESRPLFIFSVFWGSSSSCVNNLLLLQTQGCTDTFCLRLQAIPASFNPIYRFCILRYALKLNILWSFCHFHEGWIFASKLCWVFFTIFLFEYLVFIWLTLYHWGREGGSNFILFFHFQAFFGLWIVFGCWERCEKLF